VCGDQAGEVSPSVLDLTSMWRAGGGSGREKTRPWLVPIFESSNDSNSLPLLPPSLPADFPVDLAASI
jgi:hypothetical protein